MVSAAAVAMGKSVQRSLTLCRSSRDRGERSSGLKAARRPTFGTTLVVLNQA